MQPNERGRLLSDGDALFGFIHSQKRNMRYGIKNSLADTTSTPPGKAAAAAFQLTELEVTSFGG